MDPLDGIFRWCSESAPRTAEAIRRPAPEEAFWQAYRGTGGTMWPDDVVTFYRWCDGTERTPEGYLFPRYRPLESAEIPEVWRMFMTTEFPQAAHAAELAGEARDDAFSRVAAEVSIQLPRDKAGSEAGMFVPTFLPIAEDMSGSFLMVDQRPGPRRGCVFVFDRDEADMNAARWRSLGYLCERTYDAMRNGTPVEGTKYRPTGFGGRVSWEAG